ncbi:MAG: nucleotide exchange factor GrpE [Candidatus Kryptoniota bacterium]
MSDDKNPIEEESSGMKDNQDKTEEIKDQGKDSQEGFENAIENDLEKIQKQLSKSELLIGTYKDQLLRLAAEFENYRKRVEADKIDFVKFSNERIIKELLPILDDFARALANGKPNSETNTPSTTAGGESFYKGVELIYQKLSRMLEDKGVKPIESVGKEFDVMYHDVLMQVPRQDVKPHTIVEEIERGYTLHGKVIKHAKVIVAAQGDDESDTSTLTMPEAKPATTAGKEADSGHGQKKS